MLIIYYSSLFTGIYLTLIMAMTATSILICVVVLNLHHRDPNAPVPRWLRHLTYNIMAPMVCMRSHINHRGSTVYQLCEFAKDYAMSVHENHADTDQQAPQTSLEDNGICDQMCYLMKGSAKKKVLLEEVVKHLRQITCKIKEQDEQDSLKAEWKIVAKILDRFFLILFVLLVIVSSVVLLFIYPLSARGFSFD